MPVSVRILSPLLPRLLPVLSPVSVFLLCIYIRTHTVTGTKYSRSNLIRRYPPEIRTWIPAFRHGSSFYSPRLPPSLPRRHARPSYNNNNNNTLGIILLLSLSRADSAAAAAAAIDILAGDFDVPVFETRYNIIYSTRRLRAEGYRCAYNARRAYLIPEHHMMSGCSAGVCRTVDGTRYITRIHA